MYLRYMGAEAFGLVGFFAMLQAWLQLLDMGLTPTLSRQMARFKADALSALRLNQLLRTLEWFFGVLGTLTVLIGFFVSSWVAVNWLQLDQLQPSVVSSSIAMMAFICGLRWIAGLYRSGLVGLEHQTLANGIVVVIATAKFVGVLPLLMFVSADPLLFFGYQVMVAIVEALLFWYSLRGRLVAVSVGVWPLYSALKEVLPFASGIAFTAAMSVTMMNLDKLLLSHYLSLSVYGYFSLAVMVAGGIMVLVSPVIQVMQPRLTILISQKKHEDASKLFREASQFFVGLMAALGLNIAVFAEVLLLAWTGDVDASKYAAPILFWYALGNSILGVLTFPFLIQFAHGRLRLHVIGSIISAVCLIPSISYVAWAYGSLGTGILWFSANLLFLFTWVPVVFRSFLPGTYLRWLFKDVLLPSLAASIPVLFVVYFVDYPQSLPKILLFLVI